MFFDEMEIDVPFAVLKAGSGNHGEQTGRMMMALEEVVLKEQPDAVIVYGDTNSTMAGALVAAKCNIPIVHIEAGLRSFLRTMPEEINRVVTDHVSTLLFSPTQQGIDNLQHEGMVQRMTMRFIMVHGKLCIRMLLHWKESDLYFPPYIAITTQMTLQC